MKKAKRIALAAAGLFVFSGTAAIAAPKIKARETSIYATEQADEEIGAAAVLRQGSKGS